MFSKSIATYMFVFALYFTVNTREYRWWTHDCTYRSSYASRIELVRICTSLLDINANVYVWIRMNARQVLHACVRMYMKVHSFSSCISVYTIYSGMYMYPPFMGVSLRTEQERRGRARVHRPAGSSQYAARSSLENQYQTALISWPEICH